LDFSVNGILNLTRIKLFIRKSGRVVRVLVDEGSKVRIDITIVEQILDLNTAEAAYQNALVDYNRFENAYSTGGVTNNNLIV
jgi:hypothetical protein